MVQSIIQDTRYAVRLLLKQPGFTAVALLTLALGIGGSTAIFTVVDAVVIEALPYPEPDRLVVMWERAPAGGRNSVSPATFGDWAAEGALFERIAAREGRAFVLSGGGAPEQVPGALVTAGYFDVFGVRPASGRAFTDEDAAASTRSFSRAASPSATSPVRGPSDRRSASTVSRTSSSASCPKGVSIAAGPTSTAPRPCRWPSAGSAT